MFNQIQTQKVIKKTFKNQIHLQHQFVMHTKNKYQNCIG